MVLGVKSGVCWLVMCATISVNIAFPQNKSSHSAEYYLEKGEAALARQEYVTAHAHLNECLRINPKLAEAYRVRAIVREHLGEKARALTDYNIYMDLQPQDAEALFSRAALRYEEGQYALAREDFLKVLKLPHGATNTVYYSQEKYGEGKNMIFTAQTSNRDHIYNYLGMSETKLKKYDAAIAWLDSAIKIAPDNPSYWINRGIARAAVADKQGAKSDYEQALKMDPANSLAIHNLATLKANIGEADASEALLSEAIERNNKLPYPRAERAYQRLEKGDLPGALEDYNELVKLEPQDDENYLNRGIVKEKMKDIHGALLDYSKAIQLNDKNHKAWLCRGNALSKTGRAKEAVEDYSVAINLDPGYGLAHYNRAIAYNSLGMKKEACADIQASEKLGVKADPKIKSKVCQ